METQVELSFLDTSRGTVLAARGLALAMALGVAARRRAPLVAAALVFAALTGIEQLGDADEYVPVVGPVPVGLHRLLLDRRQPRRTRLVVALGWLVLLVSALSPLETAVPTRGSTSSGAGS